MRSILDTAAMEELNISKVATLGREFFAPHPTPEARRPDCSLTATLFASLSFCRNEAWDIMTSAQYVCHDTAAPFLIGSLITANTPCSESPYTLKWFLQITFSSRTYIPLSVCRTFS